MPTLPPFLYVHTCKLALIVYSFRCPRFILNYRCQPKLCSSSSTPSRSMVRSHSTTPFTLTSSCPSTPHPHTSTPSLLHTRHPLTPSQTPTFRRHGGKSRSKSVPNGSQRRHRQHTNPLETGQTHEVDYTSGRMAPLEATSIPRVQSVEGHWAGLNSKLQRFAGVECSATERPRPFTAPEVALTTGVDSANGSPGGGRSRKIWAATALPVDDNLEESQGDDGRRRRSKERNGGGKGRLSSAALYSQLAKYTQRHLPDGSSRCASAMVGNHNQISIILSSHSLINVKGTCMYAD